MKSLQAGVLHNHNHEKEKSNRVKPDFFLPRMKRKTDNASPRIVNPKGIRNWDNDL
jgi:hypothetical protein